MYAVELYRRVRLACHVEGMSKSAAARVFNIDRKSVRKILEHSASVLASWGRSPCRNIALTKRVRPDPSLSRVLSPSTE